MAELASRGQLRAALVRMAMIFVPLIMALGFASAQLAGTDHAGWYDMLAKPALTPPPAMFGIVWTVLYAMLGLALAFVWHAFGHPLRTVAIAAFCVQLVLNLAWSPVFFGARQLFGGVVLMAAIILGALVTAVLFFRVRRTAGWLMLPYLAWLCLALYLNVGVWRLNPDADRINSSGDVEMSVEAPAAPQKDEQHVQ